MTPAPDPYKYFRIEARELSEQMQKGMLDLEKGAPTAEIVPRVLRHAHTLKGAARVVRLIKIAEISHGIEDLLSPFRSAESGVPHETLERVLASVDEIAAQLATLSAPVTVPVPSTVEESFPQVPEPPPAAFRLDVSELDTLLDDIANAYARMESMSRSLSRFEQLESLAGLIENQLSPRQGQRGESNIQGRPWNSVQPLATEMKSLTVELNRRLLSESERLERELRQIRDTAENLRLVPAGVLAPILERTTRDVANMTGKRARFTFEGDAIRLDVQVLTEVQGALIQAVRNGIAHGIEAETARGEAGKTSEGLIKVEIRRQRNHAVFRCSDDGRGIDFDALRRTLIRAGNSPDEINSLRQDELLRRLMRGGVSTTEKATAASGRGVGLDVVRETAHRLRGEARILTEQFKGTTVELMVPISLSSLEVILFESSGMACALPVDDVQETLFLESAQIARTEKGTAIVHEDNMISYLPLSRILGADAAQAEKKKQILALLVADGKNTAAFGVDRILGMTRSVFRSLPPLAAAIPSVGGAILDTSGHPQIVLDSSELLAQAMGSAFTSTPGDEGISKRPILVIDDSLTTRMLEQSILESAGYEVYLAESAEEGLRMARERPFGLFLVDLEMPGMDGFGFIERARADPSLSSIPSILVTSRNAPEDKRRGLEVGAREYIVKSEFDQEQFLEAIRRLHG